MGNKITTYACIDIGTASVRMVIAELAGEKARALDRAYRNISTGHDTFSTGSIGSDIVEQLCECLRNYRQLIKEYGVAHYRVVATSALRDAENRDYVIDRIRVRTGFDVQVLGPNEEHFIWLKSLITTFPDYQRMRESGCMVVNIGLGVVQVSTIRGGEMQLSRQLPLGAMKLWETISDSGRGNLPDMMEAYIAAGTKHLLSMERWDDFTHCVFLCNEAELLQHIFSMREEVITQEYLASLYATYRDYPPARLAADRSISLTQAQFVLPMLMLMKEFFDMTGAKRLHMPVATLPDGMIVHMASRYVKQTFPFEEDILSISRHLARKYHSNEQHTACVERHAIRIFEGTQSLHGLGARDKLLLRVAAILQMCALSMSTDKAGELGAQLVRASQILGLSDLESRVCAVIVQYSNEDSPALHRLHGLREKRRVQAAKLLAILRLADSLDYSWTQKIADISIQDEDDHYAIHAHSTAESHLEEWMFDDRAAFFREVYGVDIRLHVRRVW